MAKTRWWSRSRGVPEDVYASWASSLAAQPGRQVRILAWARTIEGFALASPSALSYGDEGGWSHLGWHEVERGGWDEETGRLTWARYDGSDSEVTVTDPGRLPEVFRERVAASIVLEKFVPIRNGRGVLISGRRDLAEGNVDITWNTTLQRGLTWQTEGVQAAAEEAVEHVRTEYDMGSVGW